MKFTRRTIIYGILILGIVCCLITIYVDLFERSRVHVHNYGEWTVVSSPDCTEKGKRERYCNCGSIQENDVSALGHDFVYEDGKSADCTNGGYSDYAVCLRCDFTTFEETESLGHNFGEWKTTKEATCISFGEETRVCSRDSRHIETRQTEKSGHAMSAWIVKEAATCETDGVEYRKCSHCNFEEEQRVEAQGHKYGEWTVETVQTCTTDGLEKRICTNDKFHVQSRIIDKTGHTPSGWLTETPLSCTANGIEYVKCTACSERLDERTFQATGHNPSGWLTERAASCTLNGIEYIKCLNCLERLDERNISATGHSPTGWLTEKAATCTVGGVEYIKCINCSERIGERATLATGHSFGAWKITIAPTCNSFGEKIRVCGNNEIHTETQSVDKLEHNYVVLSNDGLSHKLRCSLCKTEESETHKWNDNDCAVCGYAVVGTKGIEYAISGDGSYLTVISCDSVEVTEITVPKTHNGVKVGAIGKMAFNNFRVTHIYLSENIVSIAEGAFAGCDSLQYLKLPFTGTSFKNLFYSGLTDDVRIPRSLKVVEICEGVTLLQESAFKDCADITDLILPVTLNGIGAECFYGCSSLERLELPAVKKIGKGAFWNCSSMKSLVISESVEEVGLGAFNGLSENCNIVFENKSGWFLYYENGEEADILKEEIFNDINNIVVYNNMFAFKRKPTDVA